MDTTLRLRPMETEIEIPGLPTELTIVHITDSHLTEADVRDDVTVQQLAIERTAVFMPHGENERVTPGFLATHIDLCNEISAHGVVFTGDIIDFPSQLNLDLLKQTFSQLEMPYLYTLGNHDWSYPHLPFSDEVRSSHYDRFRDWSTRVPGCEVLELGDVNLVAVDNSNYQLTWEQFDFIRQQTETGRPSLLFMHIPVYQPDLAQDVRKVWGAPIMMGAPGWTVKAMQDWNVRETDDSTAAFCQWLSSHEQGDRVLGVFCGHVHFAHTGAYRPGRFQYVTEPGFTGGCRILRLKPAK